MIEVLEPGLFTTVQDLGREGWTHLGISPCGAADPLALRIGNWLVGNPLNAAALEMTLTGGRFRFLRSAVVSITGRPAAWRVEAGVIVEVGPIAGGARAYLCVSGGISVPLVFGSASTHVLSRLGGLHGRALRRGDQLRLGDGFGEPRTLPERFAPLLSRSPTLRITAGAQAAGFASDAMPILLRSRYSVREESDRMGVRLAGPALQWLGGEMVSEGVPAGAVQVPPSGEPILLGVDAQTTGGYPVIGAVITADLPSLGQLRPRDTVRFSLVGLEEAWEEARRQAALLAELG
jgi:biotin-dependent carboxylase-like uncharacterized protein